MGISQLPLRPPSAVTRRLGRMSAGRRGVVGHVPVAPLAFVVSSGLMLVVLGGSFTFFDLNVDRQAAGLTLGGRPLYTATFGHGLGFSYPPIAAMLFAPLRLCSLRDDELLVTLLNLALLAVLAHATIRLRTAAEGDSRRWRRSHAAWLAAAVGV
jgi:alpha-1,2-mannosyltransferase